MLAAAFGGAGLRVARDGQAVGGGGVECGGGGVPRLPIVPSALDRKDQPSLCWMTRVGSEAKREVCEAGAMEANACPRRASASVTYTTVCSLRVRVTAMEGCGPRRRPETRTMLVVAGEEPTGAKVGTEEAGVAPMAKGAGAPGSWPRGAGAKSGAGGRRRQGLAGSALAVRRSQGGTSPRPPRSGGGEQSWCRR